MTNVVQTTHDITGALSWMQDLLDVINSMSNNMLLLAVLICCGALIKKIPQISDDYIPLILIALGGIGKCIMDWPAGPFTLRGVLPEFLRGFLMGAGAVGVNQLWRRHREDLIALISRFKKPGSGS